METIIYRQNTSKTKNTQIQYETKSIKIPSSLFCVGHVQVDMDLALRVICLQSETSWEKSNFSFVSGCELEIESSLVVETHALFPISELESYPAWTYVSPVHAAIVSLSS